MAIVKNISTEIGDVILIQTDVPIVGLIALTSFTDTTVGETGSRLFLKEFQYSTDGINFSDWLELTIPNIQAIEIRSVDTFFIHYRYTRTGTDSSGNLEFDNNTLDGQFVDVECGDIFKNSIFSQLLTCCCDVDALLWCLNVTEKLYKKGLIADFITRGDQSNDNLEDRDYIDFWRAISCFFAMIVIYGRKFEQFSQNETLLRAFLEQRNLFFCSDSELVDLYYLMNHYYDEIRQRGTIQIIRKKGSLSLDDSVSCSSSISISSSVSTGKPVDGELLRLICFDSKCDEFLFNVVKQEKLGWNIRNSSPLHRGMSDQLNVNKAYEDTVYVECLHKYPLVNKQNISIVNDNGGAMKITGLNGDVGIGVLQNGTTLGPNLVINSDFATNLSNWTIHNSANITWVAGKARFVDFNSVGITPQEFEQTQAFPGPLIIGQRYRLEFDISNYISGSANAEIPNGGGTTVIVINGNGHYSLDTNPMVITAMSADFFGGVHANFDLDNVTVKQINDSLIPIDGSLAVIVDPNLSYEITFLIKQPVASGSIKFAAIALDHQNNVLSLRKMSNKTITSTFFIVGQLNRTDKYYFVRGIIYAKDLSVSFTDSALNIGFGDTLQFVDPLTCKMIPVIELENTTNSGEIRIKDLKIKPLWTPWSTGFVDRQNFIEIWMKQNNLNLSRAKLEAIIREFLIPYNSVSENIYIES